MTYIVNSKTIQFFWSALNQQMRFARLGSAENLSLKLIKKGWVFKSDLEDLLHMMDSCLDNYDFDVLEFAGIFGIHWQQVCFRPKVIADTVSCFDAIRVEEAALLLIYLERLGFSVDPAILANKLLPGIKSRKKQLFSEAELEIFWFEKCRHKYEPLYLAIEKRISGDDVQEIKTGTGYVVMLESNEQGEAVRFEARAPKFRRRNQPAPTLCPDCGLEWRKGSPESSAWHRKEHKRRMAYLSPQPCMELIAERQFNTEAEIVAFGSPSWKQDEMYIRAKAFKYELHFDFLQWSESGDPDPDAEGILLTNSLDAIVGAACFRLCKTENKGEFWELDWVWICPAERGVGHLSRRWAWLKQRFGDFVVSSPVSEQMKKFLKAKGDSDLMKYPEDRYRS